MGSQRDEAGDLHGARGDGAGFVEAQDVHSGQGLDAVELLDKHLALGQAEGGYGQHSRGEQDEALGNHAHHRRHGGQDGDAVGLAGEEGASEEDEAHRHQHVGAQLHNEAKGGHDLGADRLGLLGLSP